GAWLPAWARFDAEGLAPFRAGCDARAARAGGPVDVQDGGATWVAVAAGLGEDGRLRVVDAAGREHRLAAAEVSVRSRPPA
ncbi:MAG: bifunctional biotin--[acetyl-CoA-carboxylase] synthetase/biotin operon repressor, partial [Pseudomonadota bacterium]